MESSRKLALSATLIFAVFSILWICGTDQLLLLLVPSREEIARWSQFKGLFYISVVAAMLYFVINALAKRQCNRCRVFLDAVNDAVFIYDLATGTIMDVNRKTCEMFGYSPDEFRGRLSVLGKAGLPFTNGDAGEWLKKAASAGPRHFEWKAVHKDGHPFWTEVILQKVSIRGTERVMAMVRDITERKLGEANLRRLNGTLRTLLKCNEALVRAEDEPELLQGICRIITEVGGYRLVMVGLAESGEAETFRLVAQAGCSGGNLEKPDPIWKDIRNICETNGISTLKRLPFLVKMNRMGAFCNTAQTGLTADHHVPSLSVPLTHGSELLGVMTVEAGEPDAFGDEESGLIMQLAGDLSYGIVSLRNAAERKVMEKELSKSRDNLAQAQAIAHLGSWEFDLGKDEEYRSDEFFRILGLPPRGNGRANDSVFRYIHPDDQESVRKCLVDTLEEGKPYDVEYRIIRADGTEGVVHARGKAMRDEHGVITRFIGTIRDITEHKKLERKYLQAQKMEAVGQLAGGIAHDFNNILTAINGYQYLLFERLEDEKSRHFAEQVLKLAEKAANLTGNLLVFSRKQPVYPRRIDLNDTIRNVGEILERLIGEDIEFRLVTNEGALPVLAVTCQIEQVLMNLATNARDAMPDGGVLEVKTEIAEIGPGSAGAPGCGVPGKYGLISVSDTGTGMDEETRRRIFEPFFTTKEPGKGTGLGLASVYGIVRQHGGFVDVYSEPGEGTTFRIYLPLTETAMPKESVHRDIVPARGSETVLLAEDEPQLRDFMRSLLEGNGYTVITASDGDHALEQYIAHEDEIDIVLLDVIMPKVNGKEVYDIIRRAGKDVKIMFMSGYTADMIERKGISDTCHLITKPFSPPVFLAKLREVLDQ